MHHSPSSLSTAKACERKWWYDHVDRRRDPDLPWNVIEKWPYDKAKRLFIGPYGQTCTSRQRSASRGTAVHAVLESYYEGGAPSWSTYIGQIALAMRAHLPLREACLEVRVEESIGEDPYPRAPTETDPQGEPDRRSLVLDGVRFLGYVDLEVRLDPTGAEAKRLGITKALAAGGGWYTFDYKSSKDVDRYAITPAAAQTDSQGVTYSAAGMIRTGTEARGMRWVYGQTEGRSYAKPVDALFTYEGSRVHLTTLVERGRDLETKRSVDECAPNPEACGDYGGCPHHVTNGGPCVAQRSIGSMLMGFREDYEKKKAEKRAAEKGIPYEAALAEIRAEKPGAAGAPAVATPAPAAPSAGAAPTAKKGFGKNQTPAPAPAPAPAAPAEAPSAPVDAPADAEASAPEPPPSDPPADKPKRQRAAAPAPAQASTTVTNLVPEIHLDVDPYQAGKRFEFRAMLDADELARVVAALRG